MIYLTNVNEDVRTTLCRDRLAIEFAKAFQGMFTIEYYRTFRAFSATYTSLYCKPTKALARSLLVEREVLAVIANFEEAQVRTVQVAAERIAQSAGRLEPAMVIIVHADPRGDDKFRTWGREQGLKVIPIFRPKSGAIPAGDVLKRHLSQELFSLNPFDVTGPVVKDMDFYGRRNDAIELLRQLQAGRIRSLFGIRKVGKTSLINRVVTLARDAGSPRIAMIDCSLDDFNRLTPEDALKGVAKCAKLAAHQGYAHIGEALKPGDKELVPVFDDLWKQGKAGALAIIFDEVDYITPASPTQQHWRAGFNPFWRQFRVVHQEAQRHGAPFAVLVSGVSSRFFRVESIDGVENAALHFVPEDYLPPFARDASRAMLIDLERRCGLRLVEADRDRLADICGDFPYWMRVAGSHIHRAIEVAARPLEVASETFSQLIDQFIEVEGAELARVALEDLDRKYPDAIKLLRRAAGSPSVPLGEGGLLARFGLAIQRGSHVVVRSAMIRSGLGRFSEQEEPRSGGAPGKVGPTPLKFKTEEWAEELALVSRRQNLLERNLREFVRVVLKIGLPKGESWADKVVKSLDEKRRKELSALVGDSLLTKLYWLELRAVIDRHWPLFEATIGDKKRFDLSMTLLNDRPGAHAKPVDAADLALYRRELAWLEERIA